MPAVNKAAQARSEQSWLERELGRTPTDEELQDFDGLIGTTRQSRETLVRVTDGDLVCAAWLYERDHRKRDTVIFQLRARMNTLGVSESKASGKPDDGRVVRPPFISGTMTRPRGSTLTVDAASAKHTLETLADGLPALRAMGVRSIVIELDED